MKQTTRRRPPQRVNDPEGTRRDIIDVATTEFAEKGFSGARVDGIAARTRASKRMIYYYFGGKEGLYIAVLENAYSRIRTIEGSLDLEHQPPDAALRLLVAFTFDYQNAHPEFVRLVMNENILNGVYLARSKAIGRLNDVGHRRRARAWWRAASRPGVFRPRIDPVVSAHVDQRACASSTSPTEPPSRPSSSATWPRRGRSPRGAPRSSTSSPATSPPKPAQEADPGSRPPR